MGAALSLQNSVQQPEVKYSWLLSYDDSPLKYASHVSLEVFTKDGSKCLAAAYQASTESHEGSRSQHLRFACSKDGETWGPSKVVAWGLAPLWGPVLFYDAATSRLFLFYSESRKSYSPGGDIKCIFSKNEGETWSPPSTLYTHEADGEVPKVVSSRPVVAGDGTWYLPFHTEPAESFKIFNGKTWCALKEAGSALETVNAPKGAVDEGVVTMAGVLVSKDSGATWTVGGQVEDQKTWLIQPSIDWSATHGLLMLFRTAVGKVYASRSTNNGVTWSRAFATSVANPNSKFGTVSIDGQLLIAFNPSPSAQDKLSLALTTDNGRRWEALCPIDEETNGILCNPAIVGWSDDTIKVAYTVWGKGIKLSTMKLAIVEG